MVTVNHKTKKVEVSDGILLKRREDKRPFISHISSENEDKYHVSMENLYMTNIDTYNNEIIKPYKKQLKTAYQAIYLTAFLSFIGMLFAVFYF